MNFLSDLRAQDIFSFNMDDSNPQSRLLVQSNVTGKIAIILNFKI